MKTSRVILCAETNRSRFPESARAGAASDVPLAGANGAKHLPFVTALAGLLTLSLASAATTPQSQDRAGGATQPATLSPARPSLSNVTVSDDEARATGSSGLDSLKPAPLMQTNSVVCATCCLDLTACGVEADLSSGHTVPTRNLSLERWSGDSVALFNFRSHRPGEHGSRFEFGLGLSHSLDRNGQRGELVPPRLEQEWTIQSFTTPPPHGLRLFNWSF